jgi:hypothetical protein
VKRETDIQTLGESENYAVWVSHEEDLDEVIYHVEINNVTLHFFEDEWEEFAQVILQSLR